jgi:hypothetical protein
MRALRLLAAAALAGTVLVAGPGPGGQAGQTGPVVASQDADVISTAVRTSGGFSEPSLTWARRPAISAGPVSDRLVPREDAW